MILWKLDIIDIFRGVGSGYVLISGGDGGLGSGNGNGVVGWRCWGSGGWVEVSGSGVKVRMRGK